MKRLIKSATQVYSSQSASTISERVTDVLSDLLGGLWREEETYHGNTLLMFNRLFTHQEAVNEIVPECKQALKANGLWKYISRVEPFWSGTSDRPSRISVTLKRKNFDGDEQY